MTTGWVWHERFGWHDTGTAAGFLKGEFIQPLQHVESPESKARFASLVEVSGNAKALKRIEITKASDEDILRIHTSEHLDRMKALSADIRGGDMGDGVSPFGFAGVDLACLAAGGTISALRAVVQGEVANAYALVRPPGHHARPEKGMGFCMFANVAVAIAHARAKLGIERVAVVDWDVHHGNGTEACFEADPDILTISLHQDGNFPPDTGKVADRGVGAGKGAAINIPLPAGSGEGEAAIQVRPGEVGSEERAGVEVARRIGVLPRLVVAQPEHEPRPEPLRVEGHGLFHVSDALLEAHRIGRGDCPASQEQVVRPHVVRRAILQCLFVGLPQRHAQRPDTDRGRKSFAAEFGDWLRQIGKPVCDCFDGVDERAHAFRFAKLDQRPIHGSNGAFPPAGV